MVMYEGAENDLPSPAMNRMALIRADGSADMGMGHLVRCMALADALSEASCTVHLATCHPECIPDWVLSGFSGEVHAVPPRLAQSDDAAYCMALCESLQQPDWVIVDHYELDARWHNPVRGAGSAILALDDLANRPLDAQLVLDQNRIQADADAAYAMHVSDETTLLAGPAYALLRTPFLKPPQPLDGEGARVLVCMGGADDGMATAAALRAVLDCGVAVHVDVIVGLEAAAHAARAVPCPGHSTVSVHIGEPDMAGRIAGCRAAVSAAGSTVWQMACLGVPMVLWVAADNQQVVADLACSAGAAEQVDEMDVQVTSCTMASMLQHPERLLEMSHAGRRLVDGQGARRVIEAMQLA